MSINEKMKEILLLDTDVLIDYLRSRVEAVEYLENLPESPIISAITVGELYAGVREGKEREILPNYQPCDYHLYFKFTAVPPKFQVSFLSIL